MTGLKWHKTEEFELTRQTMAFMAETRMAIQALECSGVSSSVVKAVQAFCACNGKIITTGLGKAGHAAEKAASTLSSLGTPATFLHPAEASHGNVGVVQPGDMLLVFSTSGKTREVIETIDLCKKLGIAGVVSVTSHPESPVREMSDIVIDIGIIKEAGHLSLAPTTSVVIMLMVSDMIATMCAWKRGLTIEQFGLRHHGGYLGRKCRGEEP